MDLNKFTHQQLFGEPFTKVCPSLAAYFNLAVALKLRAGVRRAGWLACLGPNSVWVTLAKLCKRKCGFMAHVKAFAMIRLHLRTHSSAIIASIISRLKHKEAFLFLIV